MRTVAQLRRTQSMLDCIPGGQQGASAGLERTHSVVLDERRSPPLQDMRREPSLPRGRSRRRRDAPKPPKPSGNFWQRLGHRCHTAMVVNGWVVQGSASQTDRDGTVYRGEFQLGQRCGAGVCIYGDGSGRYHGQWHADLPHGQGRRTWANGDVYDGSWEAGKQHGYGVRTLRDGSVERGSWRQGVYMGGCTATTEKQLALHIERDNAVTLWTRVAGEDEFFVQGGGSERSLCSYEYQLHSVSLADRLARFDDLGNQVNEIVGICYEPAAQRLDVVAWAEFDSGSRLSSTRDFFALQPQTLEAERLDRAGAVCGYTIVDERHFLVVDAAQRPEHRIVEADDAESLRHLMLALNRQEGWRPCGMAALGRRWRGIVRRPRQLFGLSQAPGGPSFGATTAQLQLAADLAQRARSLFMHGHAPAEVAGLFARLAGLKAAWVPAAEQPLAQVAGMVAQALQAHAQTPWRTYTLLAQHAYTSRMQLGAQRLSATLSQGLAQLLARDRAQRRFVQLRREMAEHGPPVAAVVKMLTYALAHSRAPELGQTPQLYPSPMRVAIDCQDVQGLSLMLDWSEGARRNREHGRSTRFSLCEAAAATGNPALCAALSGDPHALVQWERLQPAQADYLRAVSRAAAHATAAAKAPLLHRCADLGWDAEVLTRIRCYLGGQARLWVPCAARAQAGTAGEAILTLPGAPGHGAFVQDGVDGPVAARLADPIASLSVDEERPFALVLRDGLRLRITLELTPGAGAAHLPATLESLDHLLLACSDSTLGLLKACSEGQANAPMRQHIGATFAAAVHGPVSIAQEVLEMVCSASQLLERQASLQRLEDLCQAHSLPPVRYVGPLRRAAQGAARSATVQALQRSGADVAVWGTAAQGDVLHLRLPASAAPGGLPHAALTRPAPGRAGLRYELHKAPLERARRLLQKLAREQQQVIGVAVVPNGRGNIVQLMTRLDPFDVEPFTYDLRTTTLPAARLQQLEANGWHVTAYTQQLHEPRLHHFVVRQAGPGGNFVHGLIACAATQVHDVRVELAAQGYVLCGQAGPYPDSGARVDLIFKRWEPHAGARLETGCEALLDADDEGDDEDDDAPLTLAGEPMRTVPEELQIRLGVTKHLWDIDELVAHIVVAHLAGCTPSGQSRETLNAFRDFYSNVRFTNDDIRELIEHPSGAGRRLRTLLSHAERAAIGV